MYSLGSSKWSAEFQVVVDLSVSASGVSGHVLSGSSVGHRIHVNVFLVFQTKSLSVGSVQLLLSLAESGLEVSVELLCLASLLQVVEVGQELVVGGVALQLDGVLVVGKQTVVSISEVGNCASLYTQCIS